MNNTIDEAKRYMVGFIFMRLDDINLPEYDLHKRDIKRSISVAAGPVLAKPWTDPIVRNMELSRKRHLNTPEGVWCPEPDMNVAVRVDIASAWNQLFSNNVISWLKIIALLEFSVRSVNACFADGTYPDGIIPATDVCVKVLYAMETEQLAGETLMNWIIGRGGWTSLVVAEVLMPQGPPSVPPQEPLTPQGPPPPTPEPEPLSPQGRPITPEGPPPQLQTPGPRFFKPNTHGTFRRYDTGPGYEPNPNGPNDDPHFAQCTCGVRLLRRVGELIGECKRCKMFICMVINCRSSRTKSSNIPPFNRDKRAYVNQHISTCHTSEASVNECYHCGANKPRDETNKGYCPRCNAGWCLKIGCRREFDNNQKGRTGLDLHNGRCNMQPNIGH